MNTTNEMLGRIVELTAANTKKMGIVGAQVMVLGTFLEVVMPHLTTSQRTEVTRSFRQGIEEVMSLMDDVALPAEYHSALLERTNAILAALGQKPARHQ